MLYSEYKRPSFLSPEEQDALQQRQAYLTPMDKPSTWWERTKLQAVSYNSLSLLSQVSSVNNFYEEEGYNPANDIIIQNNKWIQDIYPAQWSSLMESKSSKYSFALISNIQKNHSTAMTLSDGSFVSNLTGGLIAGLVDPINFLSFGAGNIIKGGKTAAVAANASRVAKQTAKIKHLSLGDKAAYGVYTNMAATMLIEPLMQEADVTRTAEDAAIDLIASGVLGAGFSTGAHAFGKSVDVAKQKAVRAATGGYDSVEAALEANNKEIWDIAHNTPEKKKYWDRIESLEDITSLSGDELKVGDTWIKEAQSIVFKETKIPGLEKVQRWMFLNPGQQMFASNSPAMQRIAQELLEFNLEMGNQVERPAIESQIRLADFMMSHRQTKHDSIVENFVSEHGSTTELDMRQIKDRVYDLVISGSDKIEGNQFFVLKQGAESLELIDSFADVRGNEVLVKTIQDAAKEYRAFMKIVDTSSDTAGFITNAGRGAQAIDVLIKSYVPRRVDSNKAMHRMRLDASSQSVDDFVEAVKAGFIDIDKREMDILLKEIKRIQKVIGKKTKEIDRQQDSMVAVPEYSLQKVKKLQETLDKYNDEYNLRANRTPEDLEIHAKNTVENYLNNKREFDQSGFESIGSLGLKHGTGRKVEIEDRFLRPFMITDTSALMEYARLQIIPKLVLSSELQGLYSKDYNGMINTLLKKIESYKDKIDERDRYSSLLSAAMKEDESAIKSLEEWEWKYNKEEWEQQIDLVEEDSIRMNDMIDELFDLVEESRLAKEIQFITSPGVIENITGGDTFGNIGEILRTVEEIIQVRKEKRRAISDQALKNKEIFKDLTAAVNRTNIAEDYQNKMAINKRIDELVSDMKRLIEGEYHERDFLTTHTGHMIPINKETNVAIVDQRQEFEADMDLLDVTWTMSDNGTIKARTTYAGREVKVSLIETAANAANENLDVSNYTATYGERAAYIRLEPVVQPGSNFDFKVYSGAAKGSDRAWGDTGENFGVDVTHFVGDYDYALSKYNEALTFIDRYIKDMKKVVAWKKKNNQSVTKENNLINIAFNQRAEWNRQKKTTEFEKKSNEERYEKLSQRVEKVDQDTLNKKQKLALSDKQLSEKQKQGQIRGSQKQVNSVEFQFPEFNDKGDFIGYAKKSMTTTARGLNVEGKQRTVKKGSAVYEKVTGIPDGIENLTLRNTLMIDNSNRVLAIVRLDANGNPVAGGTANAIRYAKKLLPGNEKDHYTREDLQNMKDREIYVYNTVPTRNKDGEVIYGVGWYKYSPRDVTQGAVYSAQNKRVNKTYPKFKALSGRSRLYVADKKYEIEDWVPVREIPMLDPQGTALIGQREAGIDDASLGKVIDSVYEKTFNPNYADTTHLANEAIAMNFEFEPRADYDRRRKADDDTEKRKELTDKKKIVQVRLSVTQLDKLANELEKFSNKRYKKPIEAGVTGSQISKSAASAVRDMIFKYIGRDVFEIVPGQQPLYKKILNQFDPEYDKRAQMQKGTPLYAQKEAADRPTINDVVMLMNAVSKLAAEKQGLLTTTGRGFEEVTPSEAAAQMASIQADIEKLRRKPKRMRKHGLPANDAVVKTGAKNTIDAIKAGVRTQTTRKNRQDILDKRVGDVVQFYKNVEDGKEVIYVEVTGSGKVGDDYTPEQWAEKEGYLLDAVKDNWEQGEKFSQQHYFTFKYLGEDLPGKTPVKQTETSAAPVKKVVEVDIWTRSKVKQDTDHVYLFGDNYTDASDGYVPSSTQAVIRGLPNAVGISTRFSRKQDLPDTDEVFETFKQDVIDSIEKAKSFGKPIKISKGGIGTGKANLPKRFFDFLQEELEKLKKESDIDRGPKRQVEFKKPEPKKELNKKEYVKKARKQTPWAWIDNNVKKRKAALSLEVFKHKERDNLSPENIKEIDQTITDLNIASVPSGKARELRKKQTFEIMSEQLLNLTDGMRDIDNVIEAKKLGYVDLREGWDGLWVTDDGLQMIGDQPLSTFVRERMEKASVPPEDPRFFFNKQFDKLDTLYDRYKESNVELTRLVDDFDQTTKDLNVISKQVSDNNQNARTQKLGYGKKHIDGFYDEDIEVNEPRRLGFKSELGYMNKYDHDPNQIRGFLEGSTYAQKIAGVNDFPGVVRMLGDLASSERKDNYAFYLKNEFMKQRLTREGATEDELLKMFDNLDFVFGDLRNEKIAARMGQDFEKTMRIIKNLNYMRYMGMVTIASLGDFANAIGTMGLTGYARTMMTYFGNFEERKDMAVLPNLIAAGEIAGIENRTTTLMDTEASGTFLDPITMAPRSSAGSSRMSRTIDKLDKGTNQNSRLMKAYNRYGNFLGVWNAFNKRMVALGLEDMVVRAALNGNVVDGKYVNNSKARVLGMLKGMRFSDQDLIAIKENYLKYGSTKENIIGGDFYISGFENWDSNKSFTTYDYHAKIEGAVNHIIVTPGLADLPKWFKIPEVSPFVQFKSFLFASTNRMFLPMVQRGSLHKDPNQFAMFFSTAMLGTLSYVIYEIMAGNDPFKDSEYEDEEGNVKKRSWANKMVLEGIDRGGSAAFLFSLSNIMDRHLGLGVHSLFGGELNRKYRARTLNDFITGPIGGLLDDMQKGLTGVADLALGREVSESQLTSMRRVVPAQNAISVRAAIDIAPSALDAFFKPNNWTKNYLDNYRPIQGRTFDMLNQE